jgi:hypothetical protein
MIARIRNLSHGSLAFVAGLVAIPCLLLAASAYFAFDGLQSERELGRSHAFLANATRDGSPGFADVWFRAETPGLAAAAFQKVTSDTLAASGLIVGSMEMRPGERDTGAMTIAIGMTGSMSALGRALYQLETGTPLMIVDALEIEEAHAPQQKSAGKPVMLSIHMTLEAFQRMGGAE